MASLLNLNLLSRPDFYKQAGASNVSNPTGNLEQPPATTDASPKATDQKISEEEFQAFLKQMMEEAEKEEPSKPDPTLPLFLPKRALPLNPDLFERHSPFKRFGRIFANTFGLYMAHKHIVTGGLGKLEEALLSGLGGSINFSGTVAKTVFDYVISPIGSYTVMPILSGMAGFMPQFMTSAATWMGASLSALCTGAASYVGYTGSTLISGTFGLVGWLVASYLFQKAFSSLNEETSHFKEDWNISSAVDDLDLMTDASYYKVIEELMGGVPIEELTKHINLEALQSKLDQDAKAYDASYQGRMLNQTIRLKNAMSTLLFALPYMNRLWTYCFGPETEKSIEDREAEKLLKALRILMPIVAKLQTVTSEIEDAQKRVNKFQELGESNKAMDIITKEIKPRIFVCAYLREVLLDPTRPQMGKISKDGSSYNSTFLSLMYQENVDIPITGFSPQEVIEKAQDIFMQENINQKRLFGHMPFPPAVDEAGEATAETKPIEKQVEKKSAPTGKHKALKVLDTQATNRSAPSESKIKLSEQEKVDQVKKDLAHMPRRGPKAIRKYNQAFQERMAFYS